MNARASIFTAVARVALGLTTLLTGGAIVMTTHTATAAPDAATEGFDTAELQTAKALLDRLG